MVKGHCTTVFVCFGLIWLPGIFHTDFVANGGQLIFGHCLKNRSFLVTYEMTLKDCQQECATRKNCKSFNYVRRYHKCELNGVNHVHVCIQKCTGFAYMMISDNSTMTPGNSSKCEINQESENGYDYVIREVQEWVSRVTDFSSQYNDNSWSANQVVGHPNVYPNYGDLPGTWASRKTDTNPYIELMFAEAVFITGIDIYETYHAGGVKTISGKGECGTWQMLWTTDQVEVITHSRIFSPPLQIPNFAVKYIRIDLECTVRDSWVELDAVQMRGTMDNPNE